MPKSSPILIWIVRAAVIVLSVCEAPARDLGQWDGVDPLHRQWFQELRQPDNSALVLLRGDRRLLGRQL